MTAGSHGSCSWCSADADRRGRTYGRGTWTLRRGPSSAIARTRGRQLAARLARLRREAPVVLALPRGGVPVAVQAAAEVEADARHLRAGASRQEIVGRTVLVDDGVGTGNTARAAACAARRRGAARIVLAVPLIGAAVLSRLGEDLDEIVCVEVAPGARVRARAGGHRRGDRRCAARSSPAARLDGSQPPSDTSTSSRERATTSPSRARLTR